MTLSTTHAPELTADGSTPSRLRLSGCWTLEHAVAIGEALKQAPEGTTEIDASGVERLDSVGVLQLMRYARRHDLDFDAAFNFHESHRALVSAIEDVADE